MVEKIVVTRHPGLVEYLRKYGHISDNTPVIAHASVETVRGKHVYGVLPLNLAVFAECVTEIPMPSLPFELRGKELTLEQLEKYATDAVTYQVVYSK